MTRTLLRVPQIGAKQQSRSDGSERSGGMRPPGANYRRSVAADNPQLRPDAVGGAPDDIRGAMLGEPDAADQELAWWDVFAAAATIHTRMQLRLGRNHPACRTYDAVLNALRETATDVQALRLAGNRRAEIDARGKRGAEAVSNAYDAFVDAASEVAKVSCRSSAG
jgi:hypothetical protein